MKSEIAEYFKTDRSFKGGISLYMQYGKRISFRKQLNAQHETRDLLLMLHEELRSLAGIEHKAFQAMLRVPVKPKQNDVRENPQNPLPGPVQTKKPAPRITRKKVITPGVKPKPKRKKNQ